MIFSTINQVAQWFEREKRESIILLKFEISEIRYFHVVIE